MNSSNIYAYQFPTRGELSRLADDYGVKAVLFWLVSGRKTILELMEPPSKEELYELVSLELGVQRFIALPFAYERLSISPASKIQKTAFDEHVYIKLFYALAKHYGTTRPGLLHLLVRHWSGFEQGNIKRIPGMVKRINEEGEEESDEEFLARFKAFYTEF